MERLMCPECNEVEEKHIPGLSRPHVEYACAYVLCRAFLQADFEMRVEGTNPAAVSFGAPKPCTCDQRQGSVLTPLPAPSPEQANIQLMQNRKRGQLKANRPVEDHPLYEKWAEASQRGKGTS